MRSNRQNTNVYGRDICFTTYSNNNNSLYLAFKPTDDRPTITARRNDTNVKLRGGEERGGPDELEAVALDGRAAAAQQVVHQLDGQVERLVVQLKVLLHLDEPVDEHRAHAGRQVRLARQVVAQHEARLQHACDNVALGTRITRLGAQLHQIIYVKVVILYVSILCHKLTLLSVKLYNYCLFNVRSCNTKIINVCVDLMIKVVQAL